MVQNVIIGKPDLQYAHPGIITPAALAANFKIGLLFNKKSGESQADAAQRGSYNKAPNAPNGSIDRQWPGGLPTFNTAYARFREDAPLLTNIADWGTGGGCFFIVARTLDTTVGATSADRAHIVGSYGDSADFGMNLEFSAWSTGQARAIDYNAASSIQTNTVVTAATDLGKWRIWYAESGRVSGSDALLAAMNLTGDGSAPDPTDTTLTGGRKAGTQTITVGGRIGSVVYTPAVHKDISLVFGFNALPSSDQRLAIAAQIAAIAALQGITLGTTTPT